MAGHKHIVFDVVGTLSDYQNFYQAIEDRLGERLRRFNITSDTFGYLWIEVAEREYTYLSMSSRYVPYSSVLEAIFWRVLWKVGITNPRDLVSVEDLVAVMNGYANVSMRPGAAECIQELRDAGFTIWGFTMDNWDRVYGYFTKAGIDMPAENLVACDDIGFCKPDPEAYKPLLQRLTVDGRKPWFAAAHEWDVSAAKRTG